MCVQITHPDAYYKSGLNKQVGKKYLKRFKNQEFDQDVEDEIDRSIIIKKLQEKFDPDQGQERKFLLDKNPENIPKEEIIRQDIEKTKFHARVTGNYQKVLNSYLQAKVSKIDKIKQEKKKFDDEIEVLKKEPDLTILSKNDSLSDLNLDVIQQILASETKNHKITKLELEYHRKKILELSRIVSKKEKNISKIENEIQKRKIPERGKIQKHSKSSENTPSNL